MAKRTEYLEVKGSDPYLLDRNSVILKKGAKRGIVYGPFADGELVAYSDVGVKRSDNEDSFGINPEARALVVPDGMGGAEYGAEAAEEISKSIVRPSKRSFLVEREHYDLAARIFEADSNLKENAKTNLSHLPRGKLPGAAVGAIYIEKNGFLRPYHIADVKIYVFDEQLDLRYITRDHTAIQDVLEIGIVKDEDNFRERNVICRAVGQLNGPQDIDPTIVEVTSEMRERGFSPRGRLLHANPTIQGVQLQPNWRFLVASDGLHEYVTHRYICRKVKNGKNLMSIAEDLINTANTECGGNDNITLALGVYRPTRTAAISLDTQVAEVQEPITETITETIDIADDDHEEGKHQVTNRSKNHAKIQRLVGF